MSCLFCKIVKGEIPNYTIYEDDETLAFLDIFPLSKGHTVIIPKKHFVNLEDLTNKDWQNISLAIKNSLEKINVILNPDGCNVGINNKEAGGQEVGHVHWHIIPRYHSDGGGSIHSIIKNPGNKKVEEIAKLFF